MSDRVSLEEGAAADVVNRLVDAVDGISTVVGQVQSSFDAARSGWKGAAAAAGQRASDEWTGEAQDLNNKIVALKDTVFEGNKTLANVDEENVAALTNLL
ncbi:WXG100 family type VII secretion target [Nocardia flavorosea]|uniref:ESAT-6-like protein n=1 Tax=Nocardia flavorosea TaxID=53429 RepID=A0A846YLH6_9NOCA|nr:WXG100 family type VII secretion target [Nocardia flavorosea]NKY58352.1 hypothetical protein [Nocardia flavorosea]